jgi:hypothetical protein
MRDAAHGFAQLELFLHRPAQLLPLAFKVGPFLLSLFLQSLYFALRLVARLVRVFAVFDYGCDFFFTVMELSLELFKRRNQGDIRNEHVTNDRVYGPTPDSNLTSEWLGFQTKGRLQS